MSAKNKKKIQMSRLLPIWSRRDATSRRRDKTFRYIILRYFLPAYTSSSGSFALFGFNNVANNGIIFHGWRLIVKETEKKVHYIYNIAHSFVYRLMDNNRILCIDEHAIKGLKDLEIL